MKRLGAPAALAAGLGLLVVANALILGSWWANRRDGPRFTIELTERELALPLFRETDDTSVVLQLIPGDRPPAIIRTFDRFRNRASAMFEHRWLDRDKLRSLGFDVDLDPAAPAARERYESTSPRPAFVALEFDGDAWRRFMEEREARAALPAGEADGNAPDPRRLAVERVMRSRLFPIDAAPDAATLEDRYPDRQRYVVLPAVVALQWSQAEGAPALIRGVIERLATERIHVPLSLRSQVGHFLPKVGSTEFFDHLRKAAATGWPEAVPPRYRATLAFGRRFDPWLVGVTPIEAAATP